MSLFRTKLVSRLLLGTSLNPVSTRIAPAPTAMSTKHACIDTWHSTYRPNNYAFANQQFANWITINCVEQRTPNSTHTDLPDASIACLIENGSCNVETWNMRSCPIAVRCAHRTTVLLKIKIVDHKLTVALHCFMAGHVVR